MIHTFTYWFLVRNMGIGTRNRVCIPLFPTTVNARINEFRKKELWFGAQDF